MVNVSQVQQEIENCDPDRVELPRHVFQQASKRNIDPGEVREKLKNGNFDDVRENVQSDADFDKSYKVTLKSNGSWVEVPIYFNIPGPYILVKSIWSGD